MTIESAADRAAMLDAWGDTVYYGAALIPGMFERKFVIVKDVESFAPTLLVRTADIPNAARGDAVTVNDVNYTVFGIEPTEDDAMTLLILDVV